MPGVGLSTTGKRDARELIERIGSKRIDHLYISPIERCQLTINPWLQSRNSSSLISTEIVEGISEIDFGRWSGRKLASLRREPLWRDVQDRPSQVTFPDGESFRRVQRRAVAAVEEIRAIKGDKTHLIVSHSDTIKLITAHYLSMKLDGFQTLQVDPASFTIFTGNSKNLQLRTLNSKASLREILK